MHNIFLYIVAVNACRMLFAVSEINESPLMYRDAYQKGKKEKPPFVKSDSPEPVAEEDDKKIPGELLCLICNSLLTDAVVIPCCGNSYCDDCKFHLPAPLRLSVFVFSG